jgi:hypothetical protein
VRLAFPRRQIPPEDPKGDPLPSAPRVADTLTAVLTRLDALAASLARIEERLGQDAVGGAQEHYGTAEVAKLFGKAEFTVREWCRLGRLRATKKRSGRGPHAAWVVSRDELARYHREGLLPLR